MFAQHGLYDRVLLGDVVVSHQVLGFILGCVAVHLLAELQPFGVSMAWLPLTSHLAVQLVERRE